MLTEGWDANTVTHILGVRAFGTQLLCEQVVGRGLRRDELRRRTTTAASSPSTPRSTACRSRSSPASGAGHGPEARPVPTRVRALDDRDRLRDHLPARARLPLRAAGRAARRPSSPTTRRSRSTTADIPTTTEIAADRRRDEDPHARRPQAPTRARRSPSGSPSACSRRYFRDRRRATERARGSSRNSLGIAKRWLAECVDAARTTPSRSCCCSLERATTRPSRSTARSSRDRGRRAAPQADPRARTTRSARPATSTSTRSRTSTRPGRQVPRLARRRATATGSRRWPQALEEMDEVVAYVKNQSLGFTIPYTLDGEQRNYFPTSSSASTTATAPTTC